MSFRFASLFLITVFLTSCGRDNTSDRPFVEIRARLSGDPDRIHPMLSASGYATEVYKLTHFPLLEYHPLTLELEPVIAADLPQESPIDTGILAGGMAYTYRIRPEAVWDDGTPITAADYIFTLKAALNPLVKATAWQGFLSFIADVRVDPADDHVFTVLTTDRYFLGMPATGNFNLYPAHIYDPHGLLAEVPLADLTHPETANALADRDPRLAEFADLFTSEAYSRDTSVVQGAGPYRLVGWEPGQEVILDRKTGWWGDRVAHGGDQFIARPDRIRYKIIPDEQAALTLLRDGGLDVAGDLTPDAYAQLIADTSANRMIDLYLPVVMQYYYLALNNHNPKLADVRVRKALARCIDLDLGIRTILNGLGERIIGPFHPVKSYYDRKLAPIPFDPVGARKLLEEAGWSDSNGDGIVDKNIDGRLTELRLTMLLAAGSDIGRDIGLLLQQGARQAGIDVALESREFKLILGSMAQGDYDLTALKARKPPTDDDPYQNWHSESDTPGGGNRIGYRSPVADSLITAIRATERPAERQRLYIAFQEQLARDQPVVFLYAPKEPVASRKAVENLNPSPLRPGYYLPFLTLGK